MENPWVKRAIYAVVVGALIFGGAKCIDFLTNDSLRASDELSRGVQKNAK